MIKLRSRKSSKERPAEADKERPRTSESSPCPDDTHRRVLPHFGAPAPLPAGPWMRSINSSRSDEMFGR